MKTKTLEYSVIMNGKETKTTATLFINDKYILAPVLNAMCKPIYYEVTPSHNNNNIYTVLHDSVVETKYDAALLLQKFEQKNCLVLHIRKIKKEIQGDGNDRA